MPIVHLENVWKAYGAKSVLDGISWKVEPADRIGLVGRNGCGKTTLFHLITGRLLAEKGQVYRQRGLSIGYLPQDPALEGKSTVLETALEGFQHLLDLQDRLRTLEERMASGNSDPAILEEYGRLHGRYEQEGGYALQARVRAILHGLGFQDGDFERRVEVLSGGQKNRLALARLLADRPDLLLLDEPTNHLDLQALEWLEGFLSDYSGAFVLISHDRYFLDRTVGEIVELERGRLERYAGNYSFYAAEKERRRERRQKAYEAQQAYIARTEDYIRRNIVGQKTRQAQSRRKALARLDRLDPEAGNRDISLRFTSASRGGDRVLQAEGLSKAYDSCTLFEDLDLILWRGDRIGIMGANGSGKTTLLKLLIKQVPPDTGHVSLGRGIRIGYHEQARQDLNADHTVLEEVWAVTPQATLGEMRSFLGAFLFSGEEGDRKIGTLSGGEQSRVSLAKLMREHVNLLVMDEPTNHLDIPSRIVLEEALERFDGTVIVVSHDRYFLNRIVDRLLVIEEGRWSVLGGNYETLLKQRRDTPPQAPAEDPEKAIRKSAYEAARRARREHERLVRRAHEIEEEIAEREREVERIDGEMSREDLAADWERIQEMSRERLQAQSRIDRLFAEWEAIEAEIATIRTD